MNKPTKGPWVVDERRTVAGCNGDIAITTEHQSIIAAAFFRQGETLANAKLIASAPRLQRERDAYRARAEKAESDLAELKADVLSALGQEIAHEGPRMAALRVKAERDAALQKFGTGKLSDAEARKIVEGHIREGSRT